MFGSSKRKLAKLEARYQELLAQAFRLSTLDRTKSDLKAAEADQVRRQMEALEAKAK